MYKRVLATTCLILLIGALAIAQGAKPYFRQPAISPDGGTIAFVHNNDIYLVAAEGGMARLLVSHQAVDQYPSFSPDGKWLAFTSYRTGGGDVYIINVGDGELKRITWHDGSDDMEDWSPDGKWIYFNSPRHNATGRDSIYKVRLNGGTPVAVAHEDYEPLYFAAVSPDGSTVAFNTNDRINQWWRRGPLPNDASNIWLKSTDPTKQDFRQFTDFEGKDTWPMWAPDGAGLYFVSDEGSDNGHENIYYQSNSGERRAVTSFTTGRVLWPCIARQSGTIVFEREFGIWLLDGGEAKPVSINVVSDEKENPISYKTYTNTVSEFVLSPDNKKVAFVIHGEIFVAPSKKDKEDPTPTAFRVTHTSAREANVKWDKDSNRLVYTSDRNGNPDLFIYDFISREEKQLTSTPEPEGALRMSPDGKWCAYYKGMEEIRLLNMEDLSDSLFHEGFYFSEVVFSSANIAWSPNSKWIAFVNRDEHYFTNIWAKKIEGQENAVRITDLPNINTGDPIWSKDGTFIVFETSQHRIDYQVMRVDLVPREQKFQEDEFDKLFEAPKDKKDKEKKDKEKKDADEEKSADKGKADDSKKEKKKEIKIKIDTRGINDRVSQLATFARFARLTALSPDDKTLLFTSFETGRAVLWSTSADPTKFKPAKQLIQANSAQRPQFAKDKKTMWLLLGGNIRQLALSGGSPKSYVLKAEMEIDFHAEKLQSFREAWYVLRDNFYDGTFNGQDWNAVYERYLPYIKGVRNNSEMATLMNLMLGSLNASHSGAFGGAGGGSTAPIGDLGITFDPGEYLENGRFKVADIVPEGPVNREESDLKVGDYLLSINGTALNADTNIHQLLIRTNGKRVKLKYAESPDSTEAKELSVKPVRYFNSNGLRYTRWVQQNREYVDKVSKGRLGYLHISAMGYGNLQKFKLDLSAQSRGKEGVVIDVRYNNGGYVAPFVIDVLNRRTTMYQQFRNRNFGASANSAGNRMYDKPTVVVQNERSLSNAEMFAESYRKLGLGKIVGSGSNGWVIWTWGRGLLNGMFIRLPRMKVTTLGGEDLDEAPREPDVRVVRPIGESHQGKDSQLDAAVRVLLAQIDNGS